MGRCWTWTWRSCRSRGAGPRPRASADESCRPSAQVLLLLHGSSNEHESYTNSSAEPACCLLLLGGWSSVARGAAPVSVVAGLLLALVLGLELRRHHDHDINNKQQA